MTIKVSAIWAEDAATSAIGYNHNGEGHLVHHNKADMKLFTALTKGKAVVCGKTTLESLPAKLKGRYTVCITSDKSYTHPFADLVVSSIAEATLITMWTGRKELVVIGGTAVYESFANLIDRVYITSIMGKMDVPEGAQMVYAPTFITKGEFVNKASAIKGDVKFSVYEREVRFPSFSDEDGYVYGLEDGEEIVSLLNETLGLNMI